MFIGSKTQSRITFLSFALAAEHQAYAPRATNQICGAPRATNQICGAPRATDAQIRYNLCLRDQSRSIFERLLILHPKTIFSQVLFKCDFQTILALRLVSKKINELVLTINTSNPHSPLSDKAIIYCCYSNLYPELKPQTHKKIQFAQQYKTNVDIAISIHDLLHSPLTLNSISEDRLSFTILIDNFDELLELESLMLNQPNSTLFSRIRAFNLLKLEITPDMAGLILSLLTSAIQNPNLCFNLKQLALGDISRNCKLDLSNYSFPNFISLSFGNINQYAELILPDSLYIQKLYFGVVDENVTLILPSKLPNLETLRFTAVYGKVDLSNCFFPNLTSLSLIFIRKNATLILHLNQFPNLKHFENEEDDRTLADRLTLLYLKVEVAMKCLMS